MAPNLANKKWGTTLYQATGIWWFIIMFSMKTDTKWSESSIFHKSISTVHCLNCNVCLNPKCSQSLKINNINIPHGFLIFPGLSVELCCAQCPQVNAIRSGSEIEGWTQQEEFGDLIRGSRWRSYGDGDGSVCFFCWKRFMDVLLNNGKMTMKSGFIFFEYGAGNLFLWVDHPKIDKQL